MTTQPVAVDAVPLRSGGARQRIATRCVRAALVVVLVLAASLSPPAAGDEADLAAAREEARAAADAFVTAEVRLEQTESALVETEATVAATQAAYDDVRAVVAEQLVDQYVRAGAGDTPLFGTEDINTQARAAALSRAARGEARSQADELAATAARLERQVADLQRQRADAERQREELAQQQDALYARLRELEAVEAQRQEAERQAEQARRQAEAAAAQAAYDAARAAAASSSAGPGSGPGSAVEPASDGGSGSGSSSGSGSAVAAPPPPPPPRPVVPVGWLCPITGAYSFSDTWGAARSAGRSHRGTDMFADYGTPVVATVGGTAVNYGWEDAGGNGVFLLGDDGNRYFYAHLQDFGALGRVDQGQVVGYVGDTGNAVGTPHLHFEIHPGGSGWTNPYPTLIQYC